MRLALRIILRLEGTPGLDRVTGPEAGLLAGDFVLGVEDAPRAPDQTKLLLHCFTHGSECEAVGPFAISEQWASAERTLKRVEIPVKL
jgi:hypothetical protein